METIEELKEQVKKLQQEKAYIQNRLNLLEAPSPSRAYYVGQKMLNQQVNFLDKFDLESEIKVNPKDDKVYDRSIDLFEKLTLNASKLNALRIELNLSGDEKKDTSVSKIPYSPESVADQVGELAGKKVN